MNIIAVDDERSILVGITEALVKANVGENIKSFQKPSEALAYGRENVIDVAFLDIQMRGMTGLELAKKLKEQNPRINVIFVTGYSEYVREALTLHASGYLEKPVSVEDIKREMENLLYPLDMKNKVRYYAQTFGNFDLFVDGKRMDFHRSKSKEVMAYLIEQNGASVTRKELASILFEDDSYSLKVQNYLNQILRELKVSLGEYGAEDLVVAGRNSYAIDKTRLTCDSWEYLEGNPQAINQFHGEYMEQYSWAEERKGKFY